MNFKYAQLFVMLLLAACAATARDDTPAHYAQSGFVNPYMTEAHPGFFSFIRARMFSGEWAAYDPAVYQTPTAQPEVVGAEIASVNAAVTWLGHSSVLIQHQGVNVLTDPILTERASPADFAGPKRISAPGMSLDELPRIDIVVISHDHYDHLDVTTLRALGEQVHFYVPLGLTGWFEAKGISRDQVTELDWWDSRVADIDGTPVNITAAPSQHFSGRGLFDRDKSLWASWGIQWADFTVWYGGDTGYNTVQFKEIGDRFRSIDLGIIPIGAYEPNWFMRSVHVNPQEAVLIHEDIGAARSMAVHWGTFVLSAEAVGEPPRALAAAAAEAGLAADEFTTFAVGETRRYDSAQAAGNNTANVQHALR